MKRRFVWLSVFILGIAFCGCQGRSFMTKKNAEVIQINRFDKALLEWVETDDSAKLIQLQNNYSKMLYLLGQALFKDNIADSSNYYNYLINFYSEPNLNALYKDAETYYSPDSTRTVQIEEELTAGFEQMKNILPSIQIPAVYFHVSGFEQKMIVADSLISCSIDMYMGNDYPMYQDFFYDYQKKSMIPERVAKDCLTAWLKSEFLYHGKENLLLDRMIYEGKIIYLLTQINKNYDYSNIVTQTKEEYAWCIDNENALWTAIVERKHLYMSDAATTKKYFLPSPSTFISETAPGNLGNFIGYRIVEAYVKHTKSTCEELMKNLDSQDILKKSKYKP